MLTTGMMLGNLPLYRVTISSNRGGWIDVIDAPSLPTGTPIKLVITINSGIEVQSTYKVLGAITIASLANGSEVEIINNGYIIGRGGDGGEGLDPAESGNPGILAAFNGRLTITNGSGYIYGGGGGGGVGGDGGGGTGGGGGGGAGGGAGGAGGSGGVAGTTGRYGAGGAGGSPGTVGDGTGGTGGAYGAVGGAGTLWGGSGGAAGYAVKYTAGTTVSWVSGITRVAGSIGT